MRPDKKFTKQPKTFWASVRTLSEWLGYTKQGLIKVPTIAEIEQAFVELKLNASQIIDSNGKPTLLATNLNLYFSHRAEVLTTIVKPNLMKLNRARETFKRISDARSHTCPMPMNKQKGKKKAVAFLTAIVNMLIEENLNGLACCYDPRILTTVTQAGLPVRTLARRVDGAFPSALNPIAIWEIKEYYYTTTFGSRVADGVYETLLDGMELEELYSSEKITVKHYLMLDDYFTWWECGKSYLCRIIDLLHMGYVDEALFGAEVVQEMPRIVREWVALHKQRQHEIRGQEPE